MLSHSNQPILSGSAFPRHTLDNVHYFIRPSLIDIHCPPVSFMINSAGVLWNTGLSKKSVLAILIGLIYNNPHTANNSWIIHIHSCLGRMRLWLSPVGRDSNVCCQCLSSPSKAAQATETEGRDHVSLSKITLVYILSLFKWHAPNQGQQLPIRLLSFGQQPIFNHRRYLYICSLLHFLQTTLWEFLQCHADGWVWEGNGVRGVSPLIDVGDITYHVFFLQVNNIFVTLMKWLYNEVRSVSCPGRGVYCQIHATP